MFHIFSKMWINFLNLQCSLFLERKKLLSFVSHLFFKLVSLFHIFFSILGGSSTIKFNHKICHRFIFFPICELILILILHCLLFLEKNKIVILGYHAPIFPFHFAYVIGYLTIVLVGITIHIYQAGNLIYTKICNIE